MPMTEEEYAVMDELGKELLKIPVYAQRDFVLGVLHIIRHIDDRRRMIQYIRENPEHLEGEDFAAKIDGIALNMRFNRLGGRMHPEGEDDD